MARCERRKLRNAGDREAIEAIATKLRCGFWKYDADLRLMNLFQLSFPLDEDGQRQLVPALLPLEEPSEATEPDGAGRVRLRYEFNVVLAPLVPCLLVRSFGLIKNALRWRRGALLRYGPAIAKVWATQDERWVYFDDLRFAGNARRPYIL